MNSEKNQTIVENKENIQVQRAKLGLAAYINPQQVGTQKEHDQKWQQLFSDWQNLDCLEIQYEYDYLKNWWTSLPKMLEGFQSKIIVHGPTQKRDVACADSKLRLRSLSENKKALDFATAIGAEAMILHLTPQDDFDLRLKQLDRAIISFTELASYIKESGSPISLMLENLEYPKWPADTKETVDLVKYLKSIHPNLTACVDIAHLWHNQAALIPGISYAEDDFMNTLINYIVEVNSITPIRRFHFAGAYVDREHDIHETHGAPNLNAKITPSEFVDIMPSEHSLAVMNEFIKIQNINGEPAADIILEMHLPHQEQQQEIELLQSHLK